MIAAEHCFEQIRTNEVVDVMRAVSDVREDRGGLVSTPQLYTLVYRLATVFLLGHGVQSQRARAPPAYTKPPEGWQANLGGFLLNVVCHLSDAFS
jgi:hypothetical protein